MWQNDQMPVPAPTIGNLRSRTTSTCTPPRRERGARAVEAAVPQREALAVPGRGLLQVPDRGQRRRRVRRRGRVERVGLGLDRPAGSRVRPAAVALRDHPAHPGRPAAGEQHVRALGAQPVGLGELLGERPRVAQPGQRGELVHEHVRGRRLDRGPHRRGVERVEHGRLGAQRPQPVGLRLAAGWCRPRCARPRPAAGPAGLPRAPVAPARKMRMTAFRSVGSRTETGRPQRA